MSFAVRRMGGPSLSVAITGATSASGSTSSHTFPTITPVVAGIGPYTYLWSLTDDGSSNWNVNFATTATVTPAVTTVPSATTATATIWVVVTDTGQGNITATSNSIVDSYARS